MLGRFLSPDPAGFADGLNLYAYAGNDPVNFLDPLGLGKVASTGLGSPALKLANSAVVRAVDRVLPGFASSVRSFVRNPLREITAMINSLPQSGGAVKAGTVIGAKAMASIGALLPAPSRVPNAGGAIRSFVTETEQVFFRVFSGNNPTGAFLTKAAPRSKEFAKEALALPSQNKADLVQKVTVPAGTRLQRSRALAAFGRRGGGEQFELLERIPQSSFGPGVPIR